MRCKVCNAELQEGQSFCSYCGTKIEQEERETEPVFQAEPTVTSETVTGTETAQQPKQEKDPADKNALIGLILGICANVCCCIGLPVGIAGIVFSAKGLNSKTRKGMAIPGLILSIFSIGNFFPFWLGFVQGFNENTEIFEMFELMM